MGPPWEMLSSDPIMSCFDHVNDAEASRPWENRCVAFVCRELYQVSPSGAQCMLVRLLNCGNGRRAWATVAVAGKFEYGRALNPRCAAIDEFSGAASSCKSAAFVRLSPTA